MPTVQGVFDCAKSAHAVPDMTLDLNSEPSFDLQTTLEAAGADLAPLTALDDVDTPDFTIPELDRVQRVLDSCGPNTVGNPDIDFWHLTQETFMRLRSLIL
ncbi:hypothetical protein ACIRON_15705 [Nocardioides sp. NPDC101246]|uniref:hypothetical protein n=1 Tax=Nocardioides sp. NPDC101246 TaxID=3364336 RepID=UPI003828D365